MLAGSAAPPPALPPKGASVTYRFAVQAFFERTDFLRTLQHWILFYAQDSETRKSVLRQHQRRAIDAVVARCADPVKTRGLVWHTQGSGKTFTLLTAARLILEQKERFKNATVILVVDRTELEGQLKGWVERLLGEMQRQDIAVKRADTKAALQGLLDDDFRGLVISMIHKFEAVRKDSSTRDNVFVFIDEAHRSVAKDLGSYLMAAVPNATIIGFTGKERAERILKGLQERNTTGLAAMDLLAALAAEKEAAERAAKDTGLSPQGFSVYWLVRENADLKTAKVAPLDLGKEVDKLLERFPNARVNPDEQRQLRAALYRPLVTLEREARTALVDLIVATILR